MDARSRQYLAILAAISAVRGVAGTGILQTSTFSNCETHANISVQRVAISYDNGDKTVTFNVVGTNSVSQNVTAMLNVSAYGQQVYSNTFDPCAAATKVAQLCPVPLGTFSAEGTQAIPEKYVNMIPSIAFSMPDIDAAATLQLVSKDTGAQVACITSLVTNGKTIAVPAVSYVAAGVAAAALVAGGVAALSAAVGSGAASAALGGLGTPSPTFGEVLGVFQGMAMNGMHSVKYPSVYSSFAKNFGFSVGLMPWTRMQVSIDNFRAATGGNLTDNNIGFLQNATVTYGPVSADNSDPSAAAVKRALDKFVALAMRDVDTSVNTTAPDPSTTSDVMATVEGKVTHFAHGIQAYVEELSIPSANTFMTVLLIVSIIVMAMVVGILLVKVLLEFWALFGSFPKSLTGFRKHYWGSIARAITSLILLLYGVWVLYCIFQFTHGDSWAAKGLAGVTLGLFTFILALFSYKIYSTAKKLKLADGDISGLYEDKSIWVKYSLFYESYRKDYWWLFLPTILYLFAKGCVLAGADGHGKAQTVAQLLIETVMLVLLLWSRPYERRSGNVISIVTAVVRVLSVVCLLVFVEEFGIAETTSTIAGLVLIVLQSTLTGVLAILVVWNAINACCLVNPHRKRRKMMEKMEHRQSDLTPLDARNSLLKFSDKSTEAGDSKAATTTTTTTTTTSRTHSREASLERTQTIAAPHRSARSTPSKEPLVVNVAPLGASDMREPTIPNLGAVDLREPTLPSFADNAAPAKPRSGAPADAKKPLAPAGILRVKGPPAYTTTTMSSQGPRSGGHGHNSRTGTSHVRSASGSSGPNSGPSLKRQN